MIASFHVLVGHLFVLFGEMSIQVLYLLFFWAVLRSLWDTSSSQGLNLGLLAMEVWSFNHGTARQFRLPVFNWLVYLVEL